jgi:hypothetical protein
MRNRIVSYPILALAAVVAAMIFLGRLNIENHATAQSQQTKSVTQWEYCFVSGPSTYAKPNNWVVSVSYGSAWQIMETDPTGVAALNKLGAEGWELVGVNSTTAGQDNQR